MQEHKRLASLATRAHEEFVHRLRLVDNTDPQVLDFLRALAHELELDAEHAFEGSPASVLRLARLHAGFKSS